jgi:SAM-dependent MidA family methyltransferase
MSLSALDAASAAHSARVADYIRRQIADAGGQISFAEYMHHALYAPGLGYYSAGATKFGAAGDFVTAPEISPVFAGVLARQCAEILVSLDSPTLLEVGAGSGRLACDLLGKLAELDALPERYEILEVSPDLRERQLSLLRSEVPDITDRVSWLDRFPESLTGVIVANEVLDALPVERFAIRADGISQLCVTGQDKAFAIAERAAPESLVAAVAGIGHELGEPLPVGYVSDVCLALPPWIAEMAGSLEQGTAFLFDYGVSRREYYARDRSGGWLRCHYRHRAHNNPLIFPGVQDLTAWVDFSAVAAAAVENDLDVVGYVTQAQFLIGGGLDDELADFGELPIDAQLKLSGQVKLLTLPGEMGENFKCVGLSRGPVPQPTAFKLADRTMSL